jgi:hypothetical protein
MDQMILEIVRDGHRIDHRSFSDPAIRIGRGFDNDVIIADPFVSSHHCLIRSHEGGFTLEDLSSANGTWLISSVSDNGAETVPVKKQPFRLFGPRKDKSGVAKMQIKAGRRLHSGDTILIGHTRLRFFTAGHQVEPARRMMRPSAFFEEINKPYKAWLLVIIALCLSSFIEHQESYKNLPLSKFVSISIGLLMTIVVWSGVWSFVGWLIKRRAFFSAHLSWAAMFFLAMTFAYPVADYTGFITSSQNVELIVGAVVFWVCISCLIAGHLLIATFIRKRYQFAVAGVLSLTIVVFGIVTYYSGKSEFSPQPELYSTLVPPYAKPVARPDSVEQFLHKSEKVFLNKTNGR